MTRKTFRRSFWVVVALTFLITALAVPASAVFEPGAPTVAAVGSGQGVVASWDDVPDADSYEVQYRISTRTTGEIPALEKPEIIGGWDTVIDLHPWQVALVIASNPDSDFGQACGGSLIAPEWVLTAAHCVDFFDDIGEDIEVGFGKTNLSDMGSANRIPVVEIEKHQTWTGLAIEPGDIALLRLAHPVPEGKPIGVPTSKLVSFPGDITWTSGWGSTASFEDSFEWPDALQEIPLDILADPGDATCKSWLLGEYDGSIHICAGISGEWAGSCVGDSGGPLETVKAERWLIGGITSFGGNPVTNGCSNPEFPTIFSRVTRYAGWIGETVPETRWVEAGSTTGTSLIVGALVPGYRYDIRVRATNDSGTGPWSKFTSGTVPGTVDNPESGLVCGGKPVTIAGTDNGETIIGTARDDVILGSGGKDTIKGIGGSDVICGGADDDVLRGGKGDDVLLGANGDDSLRGGGGDDSLRGGNGTDTVDFSDATQSVSVDLLAGTASGIGSDTLRYVEWIIGSEYADTLIGDSQKNKIWGKSGADLMIGRAGRDTLLGGRHADTLKGSRGNDIILGNRASDTLIGGPGDDSLDGGPGVDSCDGETLTNCE